MLRGLRQEEAAAWEELTAKYTYGVYRSARRAGLSPEDARDITQEVFRSALRALPRFRKDQPNDTFRGWLTRITQRRIADRMRELHRQVGGATGGSTNFERMFEEAFPVGGDTSYVSEQGMLVREALAEVRGRCKEQNWQMFSQMVFDERAPEEVAEAFGVSCAHVYNIKSRYLRRLREELTKRGFAALRPDQS